MKVGIVGAAQTRFGELVGVAPRRLGADAVVSAIIDAAIDPNSVEIAFCGYAITGLLDGQENILGQLALRDAGLAGIPTTRVENACSSSACAFQEAVRAIEAERVDVAVAFGIEKMTGHGTHAVMDALGGAGDVPLELDIGLTFPAVFALVGRRHSELYGTPRDAFAQVAVKAHLMGAMNPKAHYQKEVSLEQVLASKQVADPLNILDCCPISDGASAIVLASESYLRKKGVTPGAWVRSTVLESGRADPDQEIVEFQATLRASRRAYDESGWGPGDIDLAEVHDCFTVAEVVHIEDLGFVEKGKGGFATVAGETALGGRVPVNMSGGLKSKGHPVGATGAGQLVELTDQLRGRAGRRQVENARVALAHCMGGFFAADCASVTVTILEKPG